MPGPLERTSTAGVFKRDGRYVITYRAAGRQIWETVGTAKRQAEREREDRLAEVRAGTWKPKRERNRPKQAEETLAEYTVRWLAGLDPARTPDPGNGRIARRRIAPATHYNYSGDLRRHVLPTLGYMLLTELTTRHINDLIHGLEDQGKAAEGIRNVLVPLRRMLGEAERDGLIERNPASRCDLPPPQDFIGQEIPADDCEAIRWALALSAPADPLRGGQDFLWVHAWTLALGTGLRFGELRALRWRDVDLERSLIRVRQAYSGRDLTRPKSDAGIRAVPIFDSVRQALVALGERAIDHGRYGLDDLIFATPRGRPVHPSNFYRRTWRPALAAAGLAENGYRWHDARHTCVSRLVAAGADVALVQAVAGHSDPRLTLSRYTHLRDARVTEAAERFGAAFAASPLAQR